MNASASVRLDNSGGILIELNTISQFVRLFTIDNKVKRDRIGVIDCPKSLPWTLGATFRVL